MDAKLGEFLLELHRAGRRLTHAELQPWVFDAMRSLIGFDSAFWFRWAAFEEDSRLHAWYLDRQPPTLIEEYMARGLWADDVVYHRVLVSERGVATRASFDDYTSERMRDFMRRHRQQHLMTIALLDKVPQVASGFSLYRDERHTAFTHEEARVAELIAPHLCEAWRENWLQEISPPAAAKGFSLAVLMPDRMMSEAQHTFAPTMLLEWPAWQGPYLPPALSEHAASAATDPWFGERITAFHQRQPDDGTLLQLRPRHAFDGLAPRRREAARLFAEGTSQTVVAERLGLSASTVNNYLVEVYRELGVRDKVELARLVARLHP